MAGASQPGPQNFIPAPAAGVSPPPPPPPREAAKAGPVGVGGASTLGTGPRLVFVAPAADTVFLITATPQMPTINVEVRIDGIRPDPTPTTTFTWKVEVKFDEVAVCTFGKKGVVFTDSFTAKSTGGKFTPQFPWFRGGRLTLTAEAVVNSSPLKASLLLWIFGTDPPWSDMSAELGTDILRKISKHESGGHQFENDRRMHHNGVPVLNRGHDGGGGVCQITPPTGDDLWNWKTNIAGGKRVYREKENGARAYLNRHRVKDHYPNNGDPQGPGRVGNGVDDNTVLLWETIQRFNGGTHWQWNAQTNLWESRPQYSQTYVGSVLAQTP